MRPAPARSFLFLLSSARKGGNTELLARHAADTLTCRCDWLDLGAAALPAFGDPRPEDPPPLSPLMADLVSALRQASDICFVAPIYWYSLPAPAKLFLDHWSGLLDQPDLDFPLWMRGKRIWLITARADPDPTVPALSEAQLQRTAQWLGMVWGGALHGVADAPGDIRRDAAWQSACGFFPDDA
nr:NAD(P)H-dependent oxidoreductase [Pseudorhodobacter sp. MZDSW-24AT]